ncbi:MAG TPA: methylcobamide--CoM methyltransferase [Anaerolineae bacterium]|nr:methylcobamide--CoM methyltransferase [Anaerolineae bacterium]
MKLKLFDYIVNSPKRLAMPIGINFGISLLNTTALEIVTSAEAQVRAMLAIHEYFNTTFLLTAMDLSVEAECFGSQIKYSESEIPTVVGHIVSNRNEIEKLRIPQVGKKRTQMYLNAVSEVMSLKIDQPILGGIIGPFSLAGRLYGVGKMLELTISDPDTAKLLLEKVSEFILDYAQAYKATGISGLIMAEPVAGLLSPRSMLMFSSSYIKRIIKIVESNDFTIIYHNCGAKLVHLKPIFETGVSICHFGAPMDILTALIASKGKKIISGNLDPASVFLNNDNHVVEQKTLDLLNLSKGYKNFIISSGCDLPINTPLGNVEMFFKTVEVNPEPI